MDEIVTRITSVFSPTSIGESAARFVPNLVTAVLVLVVYVLLWFVIDRVLKVVFDRTRLDATASSFVRTLVRYIFLTIAVISALGQIGVNTTSILTSLGIVGLTIGFAAKDTLSNIISGLFIFWDRPFVIGDLVEIDGHYGRVDRITMRSTRVVTPDGKMLAIPNSTVVATVVTSYTNFPHLRVDIPVTIGVGENIGRVRDLLLGLVQNNENWMDEPGPRVVATALNDYNVELELRVWLENEKEHVASRFSLREKMFETLTEAGVDMPYETLSVYTASTDAA
ncbi:MAG: mechanosensitive ion channel family protein [Myxococcota bacterium]